LSCNICNCHKERIDPGNTANAFQSEEKRSEEQKL
jgi:hypothetical protein